MTNNEEGSEHGIEMQTRLTELLSQGPRRSNLEIRIQVRDLGTWN